MVFTWQIWNGWGYENHATKKWGGRKKAENSSHLHIFSPHLPHYFPWESNLNSYQINMKHDKQTVTCCANICFFIIIDGYHIKYPYCYCKACIIWAVLKLRSSGKSEKFCLQYNKNPDLTSITFEVLRETNDHAHSIWGCAGITF